MPRVDFRQRRVRAAAFFLVIFVTSCGLFMLSPDRSAAQEAGLMLALIWLPAMGMFTLWFARKRAPIKAGPPPFAADAAYVQDLPVEAIFRGHPRLAGRPDGVLELPCLLVVGTEGFTARLWSGTASDGGTWPKDCPVRLSAQFKVPDAALARLAAGTVATVLVGKTAVGHATVLAR